MFVQGSSQPEKDGYTGEGTHVLLDLYGATHLSDAHYIQQQLEDAAMLCGATVLDIKLHHFGSNQGVTGVALLAESHMSIHTWPERQFAAIDIFMCGDCDPKRAIAPLKKAFEATHSRESVHVRGCESAALSSHSSTTASCVY